MVHIAIIGDLHHQFTRFDVNYFNDSSYDLLLCTGDLPFHGSQKDYELVRLLSSLEKPTLLIPGNHDCINLVQFVAEAKGLTFLANRRNPGQQKLVEHLQQALKPVILCGYSAHAFCFDGLEFSVIAGRPLSFGGPKLSCIPYLETNFAVNNQQTSVSKLKEVIDETPAKTILFLSHNGPSGLGARADDIWGCDFKPQAGDYGDPDLEAAIRYARQVGKKVPAVVAGHMHHQLQNGGSRQWLLRKDETAYVNAARVPRIVKTEAQTHHHHIHLQLDDDEVQIEELLLARN